MVSIRRSVGVIVLLFACGKDDKTPPAAVPGAPAPAVAPAGSAPAAAPSAPPAAGDTGFGEVAFKTYEADGKRLVFTTPTKAKITWRNMSGKAVEGTWTQNGREIAVAWDPAADNYGSRSEKFRQMGPCSMARYERVDKDGKVHDDSPKIYQQTKPRCDTVRVTQ